MVIPPEDEERPVRIHNGMVLANDVYHCRPKHLWPRQQDSKELEQHEDWRRAIEKYLAAFAAPIRTIADEVKCPACDTQVTAHHGGLEDYRFRNNLKFKREGTWEGRCGTCGYPCRLVHLIGLPNSDVVLVHLKGFPLFYHPSATSQIN